MSLTIKTLGRKYSFDKLKIRGGGYNLAIAYEYSTSISCALNTPSISLDQIVNIIISTETRLPD
jgi:hypothetical protein